MSQLLSKRLLNQHNVRTSHPIQALQLFTDWPFVEHNVILPPPPVGKIPYMVSVWILPAHAVNLAIAYWIDRKKKIFSFKLNHILISFCLVFTLLSRERRWTKGNVSSYNNFSSFNLFFYFHTMIILKPNTFSCENVICV